MKSKKMETSQYFQKILAEETEKAVNLYKKYVEKQKKQKTQAKK
jgi:hypothetical protein